MAARLETGGSTWRVYRLIRMAAEKMDMYGMERSSGGCGGCCCCCCCSRLDLCSGSSFDEDDDEDEKEEDGPF